MSFTPPPAGVTPQTPTQGATPHTQGPGWAGVPGCLHTLWGVPHPSILGSLPGGTGDPQLVAARITRSAPQALAAMLWGPHQHGPVLRATVWGKVDVNQCPAVTHTHPNVAPGHSREPGASWGAEG